MNYAAIASPGDCLFADFRQRSIYQSILLVNYLLILQILPPKIVCFTSAVCTLLGGMLKRF